MHALLSFASWLLFALVLAFPAHASDCVDVNTATESELDTLPGIGPAKATAILSWRDRNGAFQQVDDLIQVSGIGPKTLEGLRDRVCPISVGEIDASLQTGSPTSESGSESAPASSAGGNCVDINTASNSELQTLNGIGPSKADAIVSWREANGGFGSVDQLTAVRGIGSGTLDKIRPNLCAVSGGGTAATGGSTSAKAESPAATGDCVDINTASNSELQTLNGIGPSKADAIVSWREANGGFGTVDQLTAVRGIGSGTLDKIRSQLCSVSGGAAPSSDADAGSEPEESTASEGAATDAANAPPGPSEPIDINRANRRKLLELPGLGEDKVDAILEDRKQNGPFASCSDLTRVRGIGKGTVRQIEPYCTVE